MSRGADSTQLQYPSPGTLYFKHKHYVFECRGNGLEYQDYRYVADIEPYLPLLEPKRTKTGAVSARQPQIPTKSKNWWEAQCVFRGMSKGGSIGDMMNRLRQNKTAMVYELEQAEKRLNEEWQQKEDMAKGAVWNNLPTNEAKSRFDADRLLREHFQDPNERVLILRIHFSGSVRKAVAAQGLNVRDTHVPSGSEPKDEKGEKVRRLVVVGRSEFDVCKKIAEMHTPGHGTKWLAQLEAQDQARQVASTTNTTPRQQQPRMPEPARQSASKPAPTPRQKPQPQPAGSADTTPWSVHGMWEIDCRYMQEQWGRDGKKCHMMLKIEPVKRGAPPGDWVQMWATFDFIAVTGVMRFFLPPRNAKQASSEQDVKPGSKRKVECLNDDYDVGEEPTFLIPRHQQPSAAHPTWRFVWRGEETGEGEIQEDSDQLTGCELRFGGSDGHELEGTFVCDFTGEVGFTGRWERLHRTKQTARSSRGRGAYNLGASTRPSLPPSHVPEYSSGFGASTASLEEEWTRREDGAW